MTRKLETPDAACSIGSGILPIIPATDPAARFRASSAWLFDEVSDFSEDAFAQFNSEELCAGQGVKPLFKFLQDRGWQVRLLVEHFEQRRAVNRQLVVAGQPASRADGQGKGDSSVRGPELRGSLGDEINSHAGMLPS